MNDVDVRWKTPWYAVSSFGEGFAATVEEVLRREVAPGHVLFGVPVQAIGKRDGSDDVLFRLMDGSGRVAQVHLTWTRSPPETPPWPATGVFSSLEQWIAESMNHDGGRD